MINGVQNNFQRQNLANIDRHQEPMRSRGKPAMQRNGTVDFYVKPASAGSTANASSMHPLSYLVSVFKTVMQTRRGRLTMDIAVGCALLGVVGAAAFMGGPVASMALAIAPTLMIGLWVCHRVPQKVKHA